MADLKVSEVTLFTKHDIEVYNVSRFPHLTCTVLYEMKKKKKRKTDLRMTIGVSQ